MTQDGRLPKALVAYLRIFTRSRWPAKPVDRETDRKLGEALRQARNDEGRPEAPFDHRRT